MIASQLHVETLGAPGPAGTLVFVHATGLNGLTYFPMLRRVAHDGEILVPTLRGHGADRLEADPMKLKSWQPLADDLAATLSERDYEPPLVLAGHSAGAVTALLTARQLHAAHVLLIEPVVIPRWFVTLCNTPLRRAVTNRFKVAQQAAARRSSFPSRAVAKSFYRPKAFFRDWEEAALDCYLSEGMTEIEGGVELSCTPAWESAMFKAQAHGFWPHLEAVLQSGTRVSILGAERQSTFPNNQRGPAAVKGAIVDEVEGGHMLPLEKPELTATWLTEQLNVDANSSRV